MKEFKTEQGTVLPLVQLKGKDYLQVAHRLVWFNEKEKNFAINTDLIKLDDDQTVCRAVVTVIDANGARRSATATKRETKKDFPDHTEKAETGSIGRALAILGYGTQFATADLDEGDRIVDSPVSTKVSATKEAHTTLGTLNAAAKEMMSDVPMPAPTRVSTFKRIPSKTTVPTTNTPKDELDLS